jgi:hypothetical protein
MTAFGTFSIALLRHGWKQTNTDGEFCLGAGLAANSYASPWNAQI